jgi:hypothetical protein
MDGRQKLGNWRRKKQFRGGLKTKTSSRYLT